MNSKINDDLDGEIQHAVIHAEANPRVGSMDGEVELGVLAGLVEFSGKLTDFEAELRDRCYFLRIVRINGTRTVYVSEGMQ